MRPPTTRALAVLAVLLLLPAALVAAPSGPSFTGEAAAVAEVQAAFAKFSAARSWRARMTLRAAMFAGLPQMTTMSVTEYAAPDRYHQTVRPQAPASPYELFVVGEELRVRGSGMCQKITVPFRNPRDLTELPETEATITVIKGAAVDVEGTATQTYTLTIKQGEATTQQRVYVATATGRLRRLESQWSLGTATIDYVDYDAAITITLPC